MLLRSKARRATTLLLFATLAQAAAAQTAPARVDLGKREFDNNCAACHGRDARGNGPFVEFLRRGPPDLTLLSRRNGGVFPLPQVFEVIEGAGPGHGSREMPIWGTEYSVRAAEYYMDVPYDSAAFVRVRILAVAEYLNRLQAR
ncbi:MAG: c-type cytochrome [Betaproteobacteria bacterium]